MSAKIQVRLEPYVSIAELYYPKLPVSIVGSVRPSAPVGEIKLIERNRFYLIHCQRPRGFFHYSLIYPEDETETAFAIYNAV